MINVPQVHVIPGHARLEQCFYVLSGLSPVSDAQHAFGMPLQVAGSLESSSGPGSASDSNPLLRCNGFKDFGMFSGILLAVFTLLLFVLLVPLSAFDQSLLSLLSSFMHSFGLSTHNLFLDPALDICRVFAPVLQILSLTLSACLL